MTGLNVTVSATVIGDQTGPSGLANEDGRINVTQAVAFLTGTGVNQAQKAYSKALSEAASSSETLDLTALTDAIGAALTFAAVKAILITADATNVNNLVIGNAASNQFAPMFDAVTDTITLQPGGCLLLTCPTAAGWAVSGSVKSLKLANSGSGSGVTGQLIIIGF